MPSLRMAAIDFSRRQQYSYTESMLQLPMVELVALAEGNPMRREQAQALVRQYDGHVVVYEDYHEVLDRADVDAVVVCSPNSEHHHMVLELAEAGKHVLCDSPLSLTTAQADEMIEACDSQGVSLGVAHPCRFAPVMWEMKHRVEGGEIGRILTLSATNRVRSTLTGWFLDPQLSGGGCIRQQVADALDLVRWLTDREPVEVYAEAAALARPGLSVEDVGVLLVTFEGGLVATLDASWNRPPNWTRGVDMTLRVLGTEGVIEGDIAGQAVSCTTDTTHWLSYAEDMYYYLVRNFAESVLRRRSPLVSGWDGRMGVAATEAAYESARSHRPVFVAD
jgi:myo-inositol 2-dehydrogenase/D-chiro-inositol 1-dehydrogenase